MLFVFCLVLNAVMVPHACSPLFSACMQSDLTGVTILQAIAWLSNSWKKVEPATIRHCFLKAGIVSDSLEFGLRVLDHEGENTILSSNALLHKSMSDLKQKWISDDEIASPTEFLEVDDEEVCCFLFLLLLLHFLSSPLLPLFAFCVGD